MPVIPEVHGTLYTLPGSNASFRYEAAAFFAKFGSFA